MSMFYSIARSHDPVATAAAHDAMTSAQRAMTNVTLLSADVDRLLMITEALWTLLKEQHGYSDEELQQRIEQIDMRDGKLDGKSASDEAPVCGKCGRTTMKRRASCLYCGEPLDSKLFG